jgi:hypothetical protein
VKGAEVHNVRKCDGKPEGSSGLSKHHLSQADVDSVHCGGVTCHPARAFDRLDASHASVCNAEIQISVLHALENPLYRVHLRMGCD